MTESDITQEQSHLHWVSIKEFPDEKNVVVPSVSGFGLEIKDLRTRAMFGTEEK
jgi:hypothetical protein